MLTITLYNETGREAEDTDLHAAFDDKENENEFKPQKRSRKTDSKSKTNNIAAKVDDDEEDQESFGSEPNKTNNLNNFNTNLPISAKKKTKRESPEEEVEKLFKMEPSVESDAVSQQKSKFIYKIIYDNTKNREFSQIALDELWTLVSKNKDFSKHSIKSKADMLDIVIALDVQGKCLYSEEEKSITLV